MFNSKEEPKKVEASGDFVANASEELEEAVAEEIEVEDPTPKEDGAPVRQRGPQS